MALSLTTQHNRRVQRLVQGIKEYALEAGVPLTTASRRILNASHELARLQDGGSLSPKTLEIREKRLRELRRAVKASNRERQAVSA